MPEINFNDIKSNEELLNKYFGNDIVGKLIEFIAADEYLADKDFYTNQS